MIFVKCPHCDIVQDPEDIYNEAESTAFNIYDCKYCKKQFSEDDCEFMPADESVCMKPQTQVMYAIGIQQRSCHHNEDGDYISYSYGMVDGPTKKLHELLDSPCTGAKHRILRFNLDGTTDILFRWHNNEWKRSALK